MCGIAGFLDRSSPVPEASSRLEEMLARIRHRGPDGSGAHVQPGLAMGMRRLSIIDLEGGSQPIWNEDRTVGVVFNGEIYNYVELTEELVSAGHRFQTHTDTETLVHLYEEHGERMLQMLRGMFAFALLDTRANTLLIARDHFGQKPLYYATAGERLVFASELKSLFALPWVSRERCPEAFFDYSAWLSLPPPRTHFKQIRKLPAGHFLKLALHRPAEPQPTRYWSYDLSEPAGLADLDAASEELDGVLRDSVKVHLRADVPVGILLSSGLDSRTVAAYAQDLQNGEIQTFTVGFGAADSELVGAAKTAEEIRSRHHALEITSADLARDIDRVAWHLDEPVGDPAAFAVLSVCELARNHVKVLLSGEGADELFAGYDARYMGMRAAIERSDRFRRWGWLLPEPDFSRPSSRWQRLCARARQSRGSEAVSLRIEGFPGDVRNPRAFTSHQIAELRRRSDSIADGIYHPQRDLLSELQILDLNWQLAESLLQKADKMSMAASIELRTPLLDTKVGQFAARLSSSLKLPAAGPGKLALRQCLARKLNEPLSRPKKGFPVPLAEWLTGPLREQVQETLFAAHSTCVQTFDKKRFQSAWDDFVARRWDDGARAFYSLWIYEVWAQSVLTKA